MTDIKQDVTVLDRLKTELVRVLRGTSDEADIAQLFADAAQEIRAQDARIAALTKDAEPLSTNFIQTVPDKCDRIVWRGDYFHLPPKISHINFLTNSMEQEFANYERRGYEKGLAAANTNPPAPNQAQWQPIDTAPATPAAILLLTTSRTMKIETGHWARNMVYSSKADGDDCFYTHWMPLPTPPIDEAKDKP